MTDARGEDSELSAEELKARGRNLLRQADEAMRLAETAREQSITLTKAGKEIQRQIFQVHMKAGQLEAAGDSDGAKNQRQNAAHLKGLSEQNFRSADEKGQEAAELERKAFRQRAIAFKLAEAYESMTGKPAD